MACGTGGWAGPLPGDPSNASGLTATPAFGGIELAWNYPDVNPQAVAYTLIYKSTLPQFETAIELKKVGGNYYFDRIDVEQGLGPYSYWVQPFSVNGTPGEVIGPATATARPTIDQTIRDLTGMIDAGFLAQSLKTEIDRIELLDTNLAQEILDRLAANQAFSNLLNTLRDDTDAALTLIQNLQSQQVTDNTAQATSLNLLAAALNGNIAALATEQTVRATADTALSNQITVLTASVNGNTAAIQNEVTARTNADSAQATQITALQAETSGLSTAIQNESTARANGDSALASQISTIQATLTGLQNGNVTEAQALVQTEAAARIAADDALASQITTTQTSFNNQLASAQTTLQTQITTINGTVTNIGALYTAKVNVNGLIGGFGIYNNGTEVEAGFDVDRFWIGRTSADKKKPFIIQGGEVFIDRAVIGTITADMIDTRNLVIRDANGNPILGAGNSLDWSRLVNMPSSIFNSNISIGANGQLNGAGGGQVTIGGLGYSGALDATRNAVTYAAVAPSNPANGDIWVDTSVTPNVTRVRIGAAWQVSATVGATFAAGQPGTIQGQINAQNIGVFMSTAAIGSAYIGDLAVTNAKIENLTIGTEKFTPNAITTIVSGTAARVPRTVLSGVTSKIMTREIGTITTSATGQGRVLLWLTPAGWPDVPQWETFAYVLAEASLTPPAGSGTVTITFRVRRNGVIVWSVNLTGTTAGGGTVTRFCPALMIPDTPGPGVAATYVLEVESTSFAPTNHASNIVAFTYAMMESKK